MEIGLGSLVVHFARQGQTMLVVATAGDEMYCVSIDQQKSIKQWCHRASLRRAPQPMLQAG
jgi:hypothetical protein